MFKRIIGTLLVSLGVVVPAIVAVSAQQRPAPAGRARAPIRLRATVFTPTRGDLPGIRANMSMADYAPGQRGYYLVQFQGPILDQWKADVSAIGAEILDYVPDFAFKVRMNPAQASRVERLEAVAWVGVFHPGYKLGPELARTGINAYRVRVERGASAAAAAAVIAATGAQILQRDGSTLIVSADATELDGIARVLDVADVENFLPHKRHNEYGGGAIIGATVANASGFNGSTQTIAIGDTGLGNGSPTNAHVDIPASRIAAIFNWAGAAGGCFSSVVNDGAVDVDSGHGTHTTLSALGAGGPGGEGRGVAPGANLVFQAVENWATTSSLCKLVYGLPDAYYLTGIPSDLRQLFQQAYNSAARIHSDSWGSDAAGAYTTDSINTDDFVWNHRDMTITFSAGNAGADANADGVIDSGSIGSPATAKNVISVGASENDRQGHWNCDAGLTYSTCAAQGGQNTIFTYGAAWGYPANPIKDDPSAGNAQQMAAFSSRGPTDDGRIKPDMVAPGTWVLSGYSDRFQQQYDPSPNSQDGLYQYDGWGYPLNRYYKYMGGTSMSNPLVAGAAADVRDYYEKTADHNASAALVKAALVNSAVDLLDENNDGVNDNAYPIPNNVEGWGRVNLAGATDGLRQFVDQTAGLGTNGTASYTFTIGTAGSPLKTTLAWSDFPSTTTASKNLVNDLDLKVTAPDGTTTYLGNAFLGGWSQTGGSADRTNNVENVYVTAASAGTWTVEVRGFNVPNGPQPFALVVAGAFGTPPPPPTLPADPSALAAASASATRIDLSWTDNASNEDGFEIERCQGAGCASFAKIAQSGANSVSYSDATLSANTIYVYRVRATNAAGASGYSNTATATTPAPAPSAPTGLTATAGNAQVSLSWTAVTGATSYTVKRALSSGGPYGPVSTGIASTSYTDPNLVNGTRYFYVVTAVNAGGESGPSTEASATPFAPVPAAPTGLTATAGTGQVSLSWNAAANATSYTVKRAPVSGGPYGVVISLATTSYTDINLPNGTPFFYVITASNASGTSGLSSEATATPGGPVPAAPTGLTAIAATGEVSLSWNSVASATSYTVKRGPASGGPYGVVTSVTTTSYTDINLPNGTPFFYVITARNASGESGSSNEATATPGGPVPVAPTGLTATAGDTQVSLGWNSSANATSYTVKRGLSAGGPYGTVTSVTTTSYTDISLVNGTPYYYVVTASTASGESAASNEATATPQAPPQVPAAPTGLTATPGNAQSILSWNTTADATSYTIKRGLSSGGAYGVVASVTTVSYTDVGLVNGTPYYYVVTASNVVGESVPSNEATAIPTAPVPPAPTGLTATAGNAQVSLNWTAAASATSYTIKRATASGGPYSIAANGVTTTSYLDAGLVNGTLYLYVVTAVNAAGEGAPSNETSARPFAPVPATPTNLTATAGNAQVSLNWTAAASATSYMIKRATASGGPYSIAANGVTTTSYLDAGLVNGTPYYYVVTAVNTAGESAPSNETAATPFAPVPAAPTNLSATAGNAQVSLNWMAAAGATSYTIKRATTSSGPYSIAANGVTTANYIDTGLVNDTLYFYVVTAWNAAGESASSNETSARPFAPVPAAPTNLTATAANAQVSLNWTAAVSATSYTIKRATTSGGPYSIAANGVTTTSYLDAGLVNGATYYYVVTAMNAAGQSGPSNEVSATPLLPAPAAPMGLTVTVPASARRLKLSWNGSSGATSYNVKRSTINGGPYTTIATGVTGTAYTNTGLHSGRTYYYVVSAVGPGGESANSNQASGTPR